MKVQLSSPVQLCFRHPFTARYSHWMWHPCNKLWLGRGDAAMVSTKSIAVIFTSRLCTIEARGAIKISSSNKVCMSWCPCPRAQKRTGYHRRVWEMLRHSSRQCSSSCRAPAVWHQGHVTHSGNTRPRACRDNSMSTACELVRSLIRLMM